MIERRSRRRLGRALAAVVVGLGALVAGVIGSAPAAHASDSELCLPVIVVPIVFGEDIKVIGEDCIMLPIPITVIVDKPRCPQCAALVLDYAQVAGADTRIRINELIVTGLGQLVLADLAVDPVAQARHRAAAMAAFGNAARTAGPNPVTVAGTGTYNQSSHTFRLAPSAWQQAAATDLAAGVNLLRAGASDPDGDPVRVRLAELEFDEAYQELVERRPIGD